MVLRSFLDNVRKGTFFEDETPLNEPAKFRARTAVQQKKLSPGVRQKLLKESGAADPEQANRGVLYAVVLVAVLIVAGGNNIFYNVSPGDTFSPIGADQMREAAQIPEKYGDIQRIRPADFGTSTGVQK